MGFCFEAAEGDTETLECLFSWHAEHPEVACFDVTLNRQVEHDTHTEGSRRWSPARYATMVTLRNQLLDRVICHQPDRYLSLDSDILLENPATLSELVRQTEERDAAAPLTFMTPPPRPGHPDDLVGTEYPNVMTWIGPPGGRALRFNPYPLGTVFRADVIMAVVMMSRRAYEHSRYRVHRQGEDLGWSAHCQEQGIDLWSISCLYTPHIMHRWQLESYLMVGDPRSSDAQPTKRGIE